MKKPSENHERNMDDSTAYATVKIPARLASLIDEYLRTDDAAIRGHRSRSSVVVDALVEFMESHGYLQRRRYSHINTYDDFALIRDHQLNAIACIRFSLPDRAYCELCETWNICDHVRYALEQEKVRKPLTAAGFRIS
ncbi:MAG: hypothetical protein QXD32_05175 [Nitrososphaerota archaeon]